MMPRSSSGWRIWVICDGVVRAAQRSGMRQTVGDVTLVLEHLHCASGHLRCEDASLVTRKCAPSSLYWQAETRGGSIAHDSTGRTRLPLAK